MLLFRRELEGCSERSLRAAVSGSEDALQRMCLERTLAGHAGCVNTVSWDTEAGSTLISGR